MFSFLRSKYFSESTPKYRPDIDGLRALAVLGVLFYHAFPTTVSGGFVGVDVFFVISGFLISGILLRDIDRQRLNLLDFYAHRIRRIFPALLITLALCFGLGWYVLYADEMKQLGRHIAGGAGFFVNFLLQREIGYFDNASETKPLLHLWSLGIEEQYYIFWPLVLLLASHLGAQIRIVLLLAALSFGINIYFTFYRSDLAFYLPWTRFWELGAGSLLAASSTKNLVEPLLRRHRLLPNFASVLGIGLFLGSAVFIHETDRFPGFWALLPTCGALLVIASGPFNPLVSKILLSNKFFVGIGLISYPLYLFHWPLLSFARIIAGRNPSNGVIAYLLIASFLLAGLTYVFVEKPIRYGRHKTASAMALFGVMASVLVIGYSVSLSEGLPNRSSQASYKAYNDALVWSYFQSEGCEKLLGGSAGFCYIAGNSSNIKTVLIGDSTANSLTPGLSSIFANEREGFINIGINTCPAIKGLVQVPHGWPLTNCLDIIDRAYAFIARTPSVQNIIFSVFPGDFAYWGIPAAKKGMGPEERFRLLEKILSKDLSYFKGLKKNIVVTYDAPRSTVLPKNCLPRHFKKYFANNDQCSHVKPNVENQDLFAKFFSKQKDICVFHQSDFLVHDGYIRLLGDDGLPYLRDDLHLTKNGSTEVGKMFKNSSCFARLAPPT